MNKVETVVQLVDRLKLLPGDKLTNGESTWTITVTLKKSFYLHCSKWNTNHIGSRTVSHVHIPDLEIIRIKSVAPPGNGIEMCSNDKEMDINNLKQDLMVDF